MKLPEPYQFLVEDAPFREAYIRGGRISGKTMGVAKGVLARTLMKYKRRRAPFNVLISRALQTSIRDSFLSTLRTTCLQNPDIGQYYDYGEEYFRGRNFPVNFIFKGTTANAVEIKGLDNVAISVFEEVDTVSANALRLVLPTVLREEGAEAIFVFNPSLPTTPIAKRLISRIGEENLYKRQARVGAYISRFVNYPDNPYLTKDAKDFIASERETMSPAVFRNIYEGYFTTTIEGAYYTNELSEIYASGRHTKLKPDYSAPYYASFDLGLNDLCTCWIFQIERDKVKVLRYFAWVGTKFSDVLDDIAVKGFAKPVIVLPHDGDDQRGYSTLSTPETDSRRRGLQVMIVPRVKSKLHRIDAVRNVLPFCWFDNIFCEKGLSEIKQYAPKIVNGIPLDSPDHKHSDAADALGGIPYVFNRANTIERLDFSGSIFN